MLQLGREMADARAEEIAKKIEASVILIEPGQDHFAVALSVGTGAAMIARSFISKPEHGSGASLLEEGFHFLNDFGGAQPFSSKDAFLREQQLLQKAREEGFARGWEQGLKAGRSVTCIVPRELLLEEALRKTDKLLADMGVTANAPDRIEARRALEGKP